MGDKPIRSPFFYVGDKYKLVPQLNKLFPEKIKTYLEPFAGGGSSFLNTTAEQYLINDNNPYMIELHEFLASYAGKPEALFKELFSIIEKYGLSCSYKGVTVPTQLKTQYKKTYYSHYNKEAYLHLKNDYNKSKETSLLYILLIYGFNHMIRFNKSGLFNLPVGNVDFNQNVYKALVHYLKFMQEKKVKFYNMDFEEFLDKFCPERNSYVYCDPPYLISDSEYNKNWNEEDEYRLYACLDSLDNQNIDFGLTNLISHKGKTNEIVRKWAKAYRIYQIDSNYISFNDNTVKIDSSEVFVTNYGRK